MVPGGGFSAFMGSIGTPGGLGGPVKALGMFPRLDGLPDPSGPIMTAHEEESCRGIRKRNRHERYVCP